MDLPSLAWIAIAAVGLGAVATHMMAKWIPAPVAELAAEHSRFVGFGEAERPARREATVQRQPVEPALRRIARQWPALARSESARGQRSSAIAARRAALGTRLAD
jgi:hypothetical protein